MLFFEQTVLQREVGHNLLQGAGFPAQALDLIRGGGPSVLALQLLQAFGLLKLQAPILLAPANGMDGSPSPSAPLRCFG